MTARALACVALLEVVAHARGDGPVAPDTTEVAARARFQSGQALFKAGLFEAAEQEFELGYRMKPLPLFLFNAAQAARRANQPVKALALYRKFVTSETAAAAQKDEAYQHIAELEPIVDALPKERAPTTRPNATTARPSDAAGSIAIARPPARRWWKDATGGVLFGIGAAASVAGVAVLAVGGARWADAESSYASFDAAHQATPLLIAGGVTLGLGVTLLVAAVVRYVLVHRELRPRATVARGGELAFHF
jgi:hypothetical protein